MANQSRDWHRSEGSRNQGRGQQSYRDFDDDNRQRRGSARWDEDSNGPRSAEGIGDYGGYSEEGRSYGSEPSHRSEHHGPGAGDYGMGGYEQSRYSQGGYGRGGQQSGQERYGSDDYGGRRDFGGRSGGQQGYGSRGYGSESRYGSPQWGGGDYGPQGGSSFAYGSSFGRGGENWGSGESHRGKGPKGYERSDDRLKEMICERLSDDPNIDASEISIAVSSGVVKLTGTVDSRAEKYQVEELIERCGGVKDIDNQLRTQSRQSMGGQGLGRQSSSVGGASGLTGSSGTTETTASGRDVTGSGATGTSSTRKQ